MADTDSALRPITLPSLPPSLVHLSKLKQQLQQLQQQVVVYEQLQTKLLTITDEPSWDALIPFGPLAFLPGKLVHTNDVTQTVHESSSSVEDTSDGGEKTAGEPKKVLRSAKKSRDEITRLQAELNTRITALEKEIVEKEQELKAKREEERKMAALEGKLDELALAQGGEMGDEDWSVNEKGELINEEGLPMFDIREDLPAELEAPAPPAAPKKVEVPKPKPRYLIKKGVKQVVRPLPSPTASSAKPASSTATSSTPSTSAASRTPPPPEPISTTPGRLSQQEVASLLDELEAEERAAEAVAAASEAAEEVEDDAARAKEEAREAASPSSPIAKMDESKTASAPAKFAGFSSGFLAKSKQKRPSNSLVIPSSTPPTAPSSVTPASAVSPPTAPAVPAVEALKAPLKPILSRPSSPAPRQKKSIFDKPAEQSGEKKEKKKVVWDLPPGEQPARENKVVKAPIILGMGGSEGAVEEEVKTPGVLSGVKEKGMDTPVTEKKAEERPIKDMVVERPMKAPTPPVTSGLPKRVSRFRKAKEELTGASPSPPPVVVKEDKGKGRAEESAPAQPQQQQQPDDLIPEPIHTISLSSKPTASSSSSSAAGGAAASKNGIVSYADIPFDSDESDPENNFHEGDSSEDEGAWVYSEDEEDDEDFDVDSALHQREVALEYHRMRMRVGAGRGTGALGGWHEGAEGPWSGGVSNEEELGNVPSDATLQDLVDPSLTSATFGTYSGAGASQLGRSSRFRQSNRHLESAQLIIPSLLASDPTLTTSHTPLGPALGGEGGPGDDLAEEEQERLRRTLEALAEGKPLPEDEQRQAREKEVQLRGEYAKEKAEREAARRTAGKAPPFVASSAPVVKRETVSFAPSDPTASFGAPIEDGEREKTQEEELAALLGPTAEETAASEAEMREAVQREVDEAAAKGKKLSRFRQKQLGLIN